MASLNLLHSIGKISTVVESAGLTQAAWYASKGASADMISLVALGNKAFGSAMEYITCNLFNCDKVKDVKGETGWDLCRKKAHIELKSSRFWRIQNKTLWRWQHVLPDHEWAYLICAGVDINKIRYFIISKPQFMDLISDGIVTQQGGGGGQGCWFSSTDIIGKIQEFSNPDDVGKTFEEQLDIFISENPANNDSIPSEVINKALDEGNAKRNDYKKKKKEASRILKAARLAKKKEDSLNKKAARLAKKKADSLAKQASKQAAKLKKAKERLARLRKTNSE